MENLNLSKWKEAFEKSLFGYAKANNAVVKLQAQAIKDLQNNFAGIQNALGVGTQIMQLKASAQIYALTTSANLTNLADWTIGSLTTALVAANIIADSDGKFLVQNMTGRAYNVIMNDGTRNVWDGGDILTVTQTSVNGSRSATISIDMVENALESFEKISGSSDGLFTPPPTFEDLLAA